MSLGARLPSLGHEGRAARVAPGSSAAHSLHPPWAFNQLHSFIHFLHISEVKFYALSFPMSENSKNILCIFFSFLVVG